MKRMEIVPSEFKANPLELFNTGWFILTAGSFAEGKFNGMTVSWGSIGTIWGKPFAMAVVRPQRHTLAFMDSGDSFTLSAFGVEFKDALGFFGSKSGSKNDKFKETGLTPEASRSVSAPSIVQAELVLECRKTYADWLKPECFLDPKAPATWYPGKDYHKMFFGEIVAVSGTEKYGAQL